MDQIQLQEVLEHQDVVVVVVVVDLIVEVELGDMDV
jgi:hypothetical protein